MTLSRFVQFDQVINLAALHLLLSLRVNGPIFPDDSPSGDTVDSKFFRLRPSEFTNGCFVARLSRQVSGKRGEVCRLKGEKQVTEMSRARWCVWREFCECVCACMHTGLCDRFAVRPSSNAEAALFYCLSAGRSVRSAGLCMRTHTHIHIIAT